MRSSRTLLLSSALTSLLGVAALASPQGDAAKLTNPVPANAANLAAGKALYAKNCQSCHGALGKGDGKAGAILKPPPADLTDATWKHGSSDGEIFVIVRDGAKGTPMRGFAGRMTTNELWTVIHYMRSLASAKGQS